jgi:hypothetical protein
MELEYTIDKSKWGPGPWQGEPDKVTFEHAGFPCIVFRASPGGNLCGYVAVPPGHPWHGKDFALSTEATPEPRVHGGITYGDRCHGKVCHVAKPGEPDDVWWLGFDTAHAGDLSPVSSRRHHSFGRDEYRTIEYVASECRSLAEQAAVAAKAVGK